MLDSGQLRLTLDDAGLRVLYYDTVMPLAPRSWGRVLGHRLGELQARLGPEHPELIELKSLLAWFTTIPPATPIDGSRTPAEGHEVEVGRERLASLLARAPAVRAFVEENVRIFNGTPGDPHSFDLLDELLDDQAYRLAYWRVAGEEINYRRFFDINELAAIRVEVPEVFAETHRLVFQLVGSVPALGRALMAAMARSVRRRPDHVLARGVEAAEDKALLRLPGVQAILAESLSEAFRSGSRGPAWEMGLYARPWGFPLEDITTPVYVSHGEEDANAPVIMGRHLAATIPDCRAAFYPGEAHLHFLNRLPEILEAVSP